MIGFPQHMIRQKRKDNGMYLTLCDSLCSCRFKIPILFCGFHGFPGKSFHRPAVLLFRFLQQPAVIFRKSIRRINQFTFRRCSLPRSPKALQILPGTGRLPAGMLLPFPEIQPEERTRALSCTLCNSRQWKCGQYSAFSIQIS